MARVSHSPQRLDEPITRREPDGRERAAASWESLTERLIREAQEEGRFEDLPGHGKPLQIDEGVYAGDMAIAHHLLRNAGLSPPWVETDKEIRETRDRIEALLQQARRSSAATEPRLRRHLSALADTHDDAVRRLESLAPTPRQHRRLLDRSQLKTRLAVALWT